MNGHFYFIAHFTSAPPSGRPASLRRWGKSFSAEEGAGRPPAYPQHRAPAWRTSTASASQTPTPVSSHGVRASSKESNDLIDIPCTSTHIKTTGPAHGRQRLCLGESLGYDGEDGEGWTG